MKCIAIRICPEHEVLAINMVHHISQMAGVVEAKVTQEAADDGMWTGFHRVKIAFADGADSEIHKYLFPPFSEAKTQDFDFNTDSGYEWQDLTDACRKEAE